MHVITPSRMAGAETFLARLLRRAASNEEWEDRPAVPQPRPWGRPLRFHCIASRTPAKSELLAAGLKLEELAIGGKANVTAVARLAAAAQAL